MIGGSGPHTDTGEAGLNAGQSSSATPIRIVHIDDDEEEFVLLSDLLSEQSDFPVELSWVGTFDAGLAAVAENAADIFLVDYRLDGRTGLDLILEARRMGGNRPAILLTGQGSREIDLNAAALGAADYLEKGALTAVMLERSIRYALRQWMMMSALSESNRELMRVQDQLETEKATLSDTAAELAAARSASEAERRQMESLAMTDALTGISNRRHFLELADKEVSRARRYGHALCVLLLDIDNFKAVNDGIGHAAGDATLRMVAETAAKTLRRSDLIARLGGDEFAILLPQTGIAAAPGMADRIRRAVGEVPRPGCTDRRCVSVSIGVTNWQRLEPSIDAALARADQALYEAKRSGRNRVRTIAGTNRAGPSSGRQAAWPSAMSRAGESGL